MTIAEYLRQQGMQQGLHMVALRLYQDGLTVDKILKATGLSEKALNELVQKQETCH